MERGSGVPLILGNLFFTVVAIVALRLSGWSGVAVATLALLYFPLSSSMYILAATGGLRDVLLAMVEVTSQMLKLIFIMAWLRRRQVGEDEGDLEVAQNIIEQSLGTDYRTFVPAIAPLEASASAVRVQARGWLTSLFDERTGELRSDKVHRTSSRQTDGWLKVPAPNGDVRHYLHSRGLIRNVPNGVAVNLDRLGSTRDIDGAL